MSTKITSNVPQASINFIKLASQADIVKISTYEDDTFSQMESSAIVHKGKDALSQFSVSPFAKESLEDYLYLLENGDISSFDSFLIMTLSSTQPNLSYEIDAKELLSMKITYNEERKAFQCVFMDDDLFPIEIAFFSMNQLAVR